MSSPFRIKNTRVDLLLFYLRTSNFHCFVVSKQRATKIENRRIRVGAGYINASMSAINLGLRLDNILGTEEQVNSRCKSCSFQIRNYS